MSTSYWFCYHFFPVGQGLFSSGGIFRRGDRVPRFRWVYDCGTSSSQALVNAGIDRLEQRDAARRRIDLLTLSHFDQDHISGVCKLIQRFRVETLMLPYMPLAQRLVLAITEGVSSDDNLMRFFLNPVQYVTGLEGANIGRILFVPPSGGEGPPPIEGQEVVEPVLGEDPTLDVDLDKSELPNDEERGALINSPQASEQAVRVEFLRSGGALRLSMLWEFVPYNDDPERGIPELFRKEVADLRSQLLSSTQEDARRAALDSLVTRYDKKFGGDQVSRNAISLFLYAGPVYSSWRSVRGFQVRYWYNPEFSWGRAFPSLPQWGNEKCSLLYSGDGYLNTRAELNRMLDYLGSERIERTGVFQVMHHGARDNWHAGVAASIAPRFSVFSSNPLDRRYRHPHAEVLRDFWPFGAVQVDRRRHFSFWGGLA